MKGYIRSNFQTTPLFLSTLTTDGTGATLADLVLPDNVGTYEVRVYVSGVAASSGLQLFGSSSTEVVSRRVITLQPALPRAVRIGDAFTAGVTVHVVDNAQLTTPRTVVVTATVLGTSGALRLVDATPLTLHVLPNVDVPAKFSLVAGATSVATVTLQFTGAVVLNGTSYDDTLQATVSVTGLMPLIAVATSMAVEGAQPLFRVCATSQLLGGLLIAWPALRPHPLASPVRMSHSGFAFVGCACLWLGMLCGGVRSSLT